LMVLVIVCVAQGVWATDVKGLLATGMRDLKIERGKAGLLALTNATYVKLNGTTTEGYVDLIQETTGCSIGKGNLLFFHRPVTYPLKISLFNRETKDAVLITDNGKTTHMSKVNIDGDKAATPDGWTQIQEAVGSGPDTFSMVTIANAWAKDAPYDFLRCCEFHNHLCPGVRPDIKSCSLSWINIRCTRERAIPGSRVRPGARTTRYRYSLISPRVRRVCS